MMSAAEEYDLAEKVPDSSPFALVERETCIRWDGDDGDAHVESFELGITRRLLKYPHFNVEDVHTLTEDDTPKRVTVEEYEDGPIIAVHGTAPVGAVKLGMNIRKSTGHADVVSDGRGYSGGRE